MDDETIKDDPLTAVTQAFTDASGERPVFNPGDRIGERYRVERELGEGGMGVVFQVQDERLGETVALKLLAPKGDLGPEALERFKREVRLARRVTHRNVARTYDIGEAGALDWLTMELVEGQSLSRLLQLHGALPVERARDVARQICAGLVAAHDAGVVHRDLKPANIVIETSGRVVITDFGVAHSTLDTAARRFPERIIGTPGYMAPEQLGFGAITEQTDLYAFGLILFELLTGHRVASRPSAAETLPRPRDVEDLAMELEDLPAQLRAVIERCLQRDPRRRPVDARTVAGMLGAETMQDDPTRSPTAPQTLSPGTWGLAVLPLRYRGPPDEAYMADVITDEVIDLLSMTSGLRVPTAAATSRFAQDRTPQRIARELGVEAVIDGTLQRAGPRIRLTTRLVSARTGLQQWSGQFEGELTDLFSLQASLARRVAEALRVRLQSDAMPEDIPAAAAEAYMHARRQARDFQLGGEGPDGAVAQFEKCLQLAPNFPPAVARLALAASRMFYFFTASPEHKRDWATLCRQYVAEALRVAPQLPESHMAAARMHVQLGQFGDAAKAMHHALQMAPTCAEAHALLGVLQTEAGRAQDGIHHIDVACDLDPTQRWALFAKASYLRRHDKLERAEATLQVLERDAPGLQRGARMARLRFAVWRRDLAAIRTHVEHRDEGSDTIDSFRVTFARASLGEFTASELHELVARRLREGASRRLMVVVHQSIAEGLLCSDRFDEAIAHLEQATSLGLVDLDWIDHCPLWTGLRDRPAFEAARAQVEARARAIWNV